MQSMRSPSLSIPGRPVLAIATSAAVMLLLAVFVVAVAKLGTLIALAGVSALCAAIALCLLPRAAAFLAVLVLYSNVVVVFAGTPLYQVVGISAVLLLALPVADLVLIRGRAPRVDRVFGFMILFLVVLVLSSFAAKDMLLAIREIAQYAIEGIAIYVLVINAVRSRRDVHQAMAAAVLTCALLALMSIYQAATHDYTQQFGGLAQRIDALQENPQATKARQETDDGDAPIAQADDEEDGIALIDRASGPISDPNRYAQMLLVVLPWALYLSRHAHRPMARLAAAGTALLIVTAVVLTYSRGAFLTMGVLVLFLLLWRYIRPARLALAGLVLVGVVAVAAPGVIARFASIGGVGTLGTQNANVEPDGAIRGRATEMLAGLAVFLDHPVLGVGPGQYVPFYSERYQLISEISFRHLPRPREPHNLYVSIGAETGSAGLLVFALIIGTLFVALRQARRFWTPRSRGRRDLAVAVALSLVAYLGTGMFLHLSYERYLWFLVGIVSATIHVLRQEQIWWNAEGAS